MEPGKAWAHWQLLYLPIDTRVDQRNDGGDGDDGDDADESDDDTTTCQVQLCEALNSCCCRCGPVAWRSPCYRPRDLHPLGHTCPYTLFHRLRTNTDILHLI